jgi:hypothetical protein
MPKYKFPFQLVVILYLAAMGLCPQSTGFAVAGRLLCWVSYRGFGATGGRFRASWLLFSGSLAAALLGCAGVGIGDCWLPRWCWHPQKWCKVLFWSSLDFVALVDRCDGGGDFIAGADCCYLEGRGRALFDCCDAVVGNFVVLGVCSVEEDVGQGLQGGDFAVCKRRESGADKFPAELFSRAGSSLPLAMCRRSQSNEATQ